MSDWNTCRFCAKRTDSVDLVKYGTRHYAHHVCYLRAGKQLSDLPTYELEAFPYFVLKRFGMAPEVRKIIESRKSKRQSLASACVAFIALVAMTGSALSQQRTIYGSDGRVQGRVATDSQGSTVIYDAGGRVTGRTSTDSQGTTRVYAPGGRSVGTITGGGVTFGRK